MTAAVLTQLPAAAGGALLAATGNAIHWGFARYMRAPLANTGILAMLTFSAMAGTNALYNQRHAHPAPLFAPPIVRQAAIAPVEMEPVVPATRPRQPVAVTPLVTSGETTGSVDPQTDAEAIDNADVAEAQRKLQTMRFYDGEVDGLYGPRTARAIRKFEEQAGLEPSGQLTPEVLEAILKAPPILPQRASEMVAAPDPLNAIIESEAADASFRPVADKPTVVTELAPLPAPAPLQLDTDAPARKKPVLHRELPQSPEEALDLVVQTAGEAIETIADGVQSLAMSSPPKKKPAMPIPEVASQPAPQAAGPIETASIAQPRPGVPLVLPEEPAPTSSDDVAELDTDARPEDLMPPFSVTDPVIVAKVQRGLASLGFLHGPADGVAGEATAKAIRNFEVYYNYKVTGRISPELLDLLVQNGASI